MKRILTILLILFSLVGKAQVGGTSFAGGGNYVFLSACDEVEPGVFKAVLRLFNLGTGQTIKFLNIDMTPHATVHIVDGQDESECSFLIRGTFSTNKNKSCYADNGDTLEGYLITIYRDSSKMTTVIEDLEGNTVIGAIEVRGNFCSGTIEVEFNQNVDAFERLRVSTPHAIFDAAHLYDKQPYLFDEILDGGATSMHHANESVVDMAVSSASDRVLRQSFRYMVYQPGKSLLVTLTGTFSSFANEDIVSRIGLFDDENDKTVDAGGNGYFFEYSNDSLFAVERSFVTGYQVDNKVYLDSWNLSTPLIDPIKNNRIIMDFQGGTGRVRVGFNLNGNNVWVHEFNHSNILASNFTTRVSLPVRYEITQTGVTGSTMKMGYISVVSEGGDAPHGRFRTTNLPSIGLSSGVETPILAIRCQSGFNRMSLKILSLSLANSNNSTILLKAYSASSTTGGVYTAIANSGSETNPSVATFPDAIPIGSIYSSGFVRSADLNVDNARLLTGADIEGNSQIIIITLTPTTNTTAFLTANWQEIY